MGHACLWGNRTTLKVDPMAFAGKLCANLANTAPPLPWVVAILPQMVLKFLLPCLATYTTLFPKYHEASALSLTPSNLKMAWFSFCWTKDLN